MKDTSWISEPVVVPCPACGCEDETAGIETHPGRGYGSNTSKTRIPPGESFYCADKVGCGFYVELNQIGVLEGMFRKLQG